MNNKVITYDKVIETIRKFNDIQFIYKNSLYNLTLFSRKWYLSATGEENFTKELADGKDIDKLIDKLDEILIKDKKLKEIINDHLYGEGTLILFDKYK